MSASCHKQTMHHSRQRLYSITSSARAATARRHFEAERLCGGQMDHEIEPSRLHERQVGWLGASSSMAAPSARRWRPIPVLTPAR